MNLQQLRYAATLAEAGSFTKAADEMFIVQSALSQQIRKLENELGVDLFERTTRSVALTAAGEALLPLVRQVLAGVDQIKINAQAISGTIGGRLTIGMMEVPSESLDVAALMAMFHSRYPAVTVTLRSGGSDALIEAIRDRKIDVAIVGSNVTAAGSLTSMELFREPLVAVVLAGSPLAAKATVALPELAELPFIDFPPGYGLRRETDRGFTGVSRRVAFEVTRVDEVIQFVRRELGVALLPLSVATSRLGDDAALALRPVDGANLHRQVNLVARSSRLRSAACQAFIDCVQDHVGRAATAGFPQR
ncbi:LysR family transcriptional regulator [Mycobacterium avium subsp. hominissuis]|uniref:LysR family transcriptional regulator n=1 Tax=Mycobacterium avium TaxID=1764 RepID=UPI00293B4B3F|nr:LysR family transcriptional regulator [Mycobacterium avium]MDV3249026.1 LysR family transcriptional regulator [Mycobacterium avium subsp. hominissuis]MDV3274671.1 LysR family transcriptional regulator [Mycobacterium avium subsp. hominissuis]MDV3322285.1 LysR family transcriptional regulator [Mycobacterium avium subsp. hominissuis]